MAIDGINTKPGTAVSDRTRVRHGKGNMGQVASSATVPASSSEDQISLTGTVQQLQSLEASLASLPAYDAGKVDALKTSLENGDYQADPYRIADNIIALEQGLAPATDK